MDRRDFLLSLASLTAWSGFWPNRAHSQENLGSSKERKPHTPPATGPAEVREGDMLYRTLGSTGQRVSAIGLGGYHAGMPRDESESIKLIRTAIDRGMTFMDNSWGYHDGKSETWMGQALRDGYRDKVFLMTKFDGRTKAAAARQIDESLRRLQTDRIDLIQMHEIIRMEDPDRAFAEGGAMEAVHAARKAGKVRYIGFTGHKDPVVHNRMLDAAEEHKVRFDTVQLPINVLDAHFRSFARDTLPRLVRDEIGVLGMKPMASGTIIQNKIATPGECLTYALTMPTSVVITGMDSMRVLEQNLEIVKNYKPLDERAMRDLLTRTEKPAQAGKYERFKTTQQFDSTAAHPEWMG